MNNMRFYPFWVACFAASATFGLSNSASGETSALISTDLSDLSNNDVQQLKAIATSQKFKVEVTEPRDVSLSLGQPKSPNSPAKLAIVGVGGADVTPEKGDDSLTQQVKFSPPWPDNEDPKPTEEVNIIGEADPIAIASKQLPPTLQSPGLDVLNKDKSNLDIYPQADATPQVQRVNTDDHNLTQPYDLGKEPQWLVTMLGELALQETYGNPPELAQNNLPSSPGTPGSEEPEVLIAEVVVAGTDNQQLVDTAYGAIAVQPGRTATRSQLQQDINAIFATGLFRNVRAIPEDTPLGVRVTFEVEPNPPLQAVVIEGDAVLPQEVVDASFENQLGQIINLNRIEEAIEDIQAWYQQNGYVLAQVIEAPDVTTDGIITLKVAEGIISEVTVRFLNADGDATDADGNPVTGRTRDFIVTREIELQPGDVFNQATAQQDLTRVFRLGIFDDVRLQLEPASNDPTQANMVVNVIERSTGSLAFGGGISSATGLFGTLSYREANLGGNNHQLGAEIQVGERVLLVDLSFTDPWIAGDPYRTSYTVNAFRRRGISVIFEEGEEDVRLPNEDRPRVIRMGGGISFTRPFAENPFVDPDWIASLGFQYQRVQVTDADENITPRDEKGKLLSASESGEDDLFTFQFGLARDRRNNPQVPTSGYAFRFGTEQSIPIGSGNIFFNRVRGSYSQYVPVNLLQLVPEAPQALAFNFQAGTIIGDFPPYEAFPLGGANTVRGWREGALGAARSFVLGSVEYRFPVFSIANFLIGGALFVDAAHALGTQSSVQGNPGGIRGKPGSGIGFGAGIRVQSPLGPIRVDYGINNEGGNQIHFGIGERF